MYYNFNDNELIYLVKENQDKAWKELVCKYEHYLGKLYKSGRGYGIPKYDFMQEGLTVLNIAVNKYDSNGSISFFTYYNICLMRHIIRYSKRYVFFRETNDYDFQRVSDNKNNSINFFIRKLLESEDQEMVSILKYCSKYNATVKNYCKIFNKPYEKTYYEYKKFLKNLRKKVD